MLYKKVFKLPDIEYSVETMLHSDINHVPSKHEYENDDNYATHIVFDDGRKFALDRPGKIVGRLTMTIQKKSMDSNSFILFIDSLARRGYGMHLERERSMPFPQQGL